MMQHITKHIILTLSAAVVTIGILGTVFPLTAYAACKGNRDCKGGTPYCVSGKCVECRNPGSGNDCNNNKICSSNNRCVAPTPTPTPYVPPPPSSGGGSGSGGGGSGSGGGGSNNDGGKNNCRGQSDPLHPYCIKVSDNRWIWGCRKNNDCPRDYPVCINTSCDVMKSGVVGGTGGKSCLENRDCPNNNPYCLNGHCAECTGNARCSGGLVCSRSGNCVVPTPTPTQGSAPPPSPPPTATPTPRPPTATPNPTTGSITGCVFNDLNNDGMRNGTEQNYAGTVDVRLSPAAGNRTSPATGCYRFSAVPFRSYSLRLFTVPEGFTATYPPVASTYAITLSQASTCTISPDNGPPVCSNGNITNANFGITDRLPWLQAISFNIRNDNGFTDPIPAASVCSNVAIRDDSTSGIPGIIYVGAGSTNFGQGNASSKNWVVRGAGTAYSGSGGLRTSYDSLLLTLTRNRVTPIPLSSYCNTSNCTISNSIADQPYIVSSGNVVLGNVTITSKKVLLLVNDNLRLTGNIQVSPGAFLMIAAKGDITVANTVGTTTLSCAGAGTPQLQGFFSTDRNFTIEGGAVCPTADRQLNMAGSVVTNARLTSGGRFTNNRTLCGNNTLYPSFTIQPRLDFIFNAPEYMLRESTNWQEVAP